MLAKKTVEDYAKQLSEEFHIPEKVILKICGTALANLVKLMNENNHCWIKGFGSFYADYWHIANLLNEKYGTCIRKINCTRRTDKNAIKRNRKLRLAKEVLSKQSEGGSGLRNNTGSIETMPVQAWGGEDQTIIEPWD